MTAFVQYKHSFSSYSFIYLSYRYDKGIKSMQSGKTLGSDWRNLRNEQPG